jgi:hypothetical protein
VRRRPGKPSLRDIVRRPFFRTRRAWPLAPPCHQGRFSSFSAKRRPIRRTRGVFRRWIPLNGADFSTSFSQPVE